MPNKHSQTSKNTSAKKPSPEDLGKMLVSIYETGYLDAQKSYKHSFFKGVATGFGSVLGATLLIALLLWLLAIASHVPFIGEAVENIRQTIQSQPK